MLRVLNKYYPYIHCLLFTIFLSSYALFDMYLGYGILVEGLVLLVAAIIWTGSILTALFRKKINKDIMPVILFISIVSDIWIIYLFLNRLW